jgi:plastocyanin
MIALRGAAIALAGVLFLGACGDTTSDDDQGAAPTTAAAASDTCPSGSGLEGTISDHGAAPATGAELAIEAGDSYFEPTCVTGTPSGEVQLVVENTGGVLHNVSIPDQGIDTDVAPGETITVTVDVSGGALPYFCKFHRTSGMVGSLIGSG